MYIVATQHLSILMATRGYDFERPESLRYFDEAESLSTELSRQFPNDEGLRSFIQTIRNIKEPCLSWPEEPESD